MTIPTISYGVNKEDVHLCVGDAYRTSEKTTLHLQQLDDASGAVRGKMTCHILSHTQELLTKEHTHGIIGIIPNRYILKKKTTKRQSYFLFSCRKTNKLSLGIETLFLRNDHKFCSHKHNPLIPHGIKYPSNQMLGYKMPTTEQPLPLEAHGTIHSVQASGGSMD